MSMAARELLRRPGSFLVPLGILLLLALLQLYPSAILDGILLDSTAAVRNVPADLVVYSHEANGVIVRSRLDAATRARVEAVDGVDRAATFDVAVFTGTVEGWDEPVGFAVLASDRPLGAHHLPGPGEALADSSLRERAGITEGTELVVGPFRAPVTVVGFTSGTNLWFAGGLVVDKSTWLSVLGRGAAAADAGASGTASQAVLVTVERGAAPADVAAAIDVATGGQTETLTRAEAVRAMPGIEQQQSTFGYIRAVTLTVALVVVGLFLSFVTLERAPLYAVLKAVGASSRQLFVGMVAQVLLIAVVAVLAAALVTWGLTQIPFELPTVMRLARVVETLVALGATAVAGSALSLRRVVAIDPADAIG
jgi:putative ABC transport system permease protein